MRFPLLLIAAVAVAAAPAAAQKLGARTESPERLGRDLSAAGADSEVEAIAAEAAAHALGTAANPVRVGGPQGERAYLARLRCADGSAPVPGARQPGPVGAYGTLVGLFPLDCGAAAPGRATIAFDMYHAEHREDRAPPGFTLAPR